MLTSPVRIPLLVGLNDTWIVQLFPIANPFPQLFVSRKSPLTEIVEIFIFELPMLLNRTFFGGLVCPTDIAAKLQRRRPQARCRRAQIQENEILIIPVIHLGGNGEVFHAIGIEISGAGTRAIIGWDIERYGIPERPVAVAWHDYGS